MKGDFSCAGGYGVGGGLCGAGALAGVAYSAYKLADKSARATRALGNGLQVGKTSGYDA